MPITNATLAQKINDLVEQWETHQSEQQAWMFGAKDGGPSSDGLFPLSDFQGNIVLAKSPLKLQDEVDNVVTGANTARDDAQAAQTAAELAETNAQSSENDAETAETGAVAAKDTATTRAAEAATDAANALGSANNAATSESNAATSAANAATSETNAATSETNAATSATAAAASAAAALVSELAAAATAAAIGDLDSLSDVVITTPADKHAVMYDGANFVNRVLVEADISDLQSYSLSSHTHDGITDTNLLDKSAGETITGTWIFPLMKLSSANGQLLLDATASFASQITTRNVAGTALSVFKRHSTIDDLNIGNASFAMKLFGSSVDVQAALTATSYDGVLAANLLDKSVDEDIAGRYKFTNSPTSSLDGSILLSNSVVPILGFTETGAAVNSKVWDVTVYQEAMLFRTADDAGGANVEWLRVERTGTTVDSIAFTGNAFSVASGDIALGYNVTATNELLKTFATAHAVGNVPSELSMILNDGTPSGVRIKNTRTGSFNSQAIHFDVHEGGVAVRADALVINHTGVVDIVGKLALGTGAHADNDILLLLDVDRAWDFRQDGDGAGTSLALQATNDLKRFQINSNTGVRQFAFLQSSTANPEFEIYDKLGTDYARFFHDGTDFNTLFVNTTDWNMTGVTLKADVIQMNGGSIIKNVSGAAQLFFYDEANGLRWRIGTTGAAGDDFILYDNDLAISIFEVDDSTGVFNFAKAMTKSSLGIPYYVTTGYIGGKITVSSTTPSTPAKGDIWYDTT